MNCGINQNYSLANNISAESTSNWNFDGSTCEGFTPVGNSGTNLHFTGSLNGNGYTVTGLTINRNAAYEIGLFGDCYGAAIQNIGLTGLAIKGYVITGGLADMLVIIPKSPIAMLRECEWI